MARQTITRALAMAIAVDAGNRSMRDAGRTVWAPADYDVACETFARLWPESSDETIGS